MKLSRREQRFLDEYFVDLNATKAVLRAKITDNRSSAKVIGMRMVRKDSIRSAIDAHFAEIQQQNKALIYRTLIEYQNLAFGNAQNLFDADGKPFPISELDADVAATIAGIEFEDLYEGRGEAREYVGQVRKYKLVDKKGALDSLSRYLGMFNDSLRITAPPGQAPIATATGITIDPSKLSNEQLKVMVEVFGKNVGAP